MGGDGSSRSEGCRTCCSMGQGWKVQLTGHFALLEVALVISIGHLYREMCVWLIPSPTEAAVLLLCTKSLVGGLVLFHC